MYPLLKGGSRKQTQSTNEVVDKLRRVRIALEFFGRAISNDKKVEKEIKIQRVAVQLTMGQGRTCACIEGNPNSNCCVRVRESIIKSFRKVAVKLLQ